MKKLILMISLLAAASLAAKAQTNIIPASGPATNAPSILAPLATAEGWLSSFGSNTWNATHGYIQTGAAWQNQLQFADALEAGLNVLEAATNSGLTLSDNLLTAGVAGTIVSDAVDAAWRFDYKDVQWQFGAGLIYDKINDKLAADIMGELQKKMTPNTHAYLRLDLPCEGKKSALQLIIGAGGEF